MYSISNNEILMDNISLANLSKTFGTPLYIFSEKKLLDNYNELYDAFNSLYPKIQIAYSTKNNVLGGIVEKIFQKTDWFEVTSLGETQSVKKVSSKVRVKPNIIQTNLYKPSDLILESIKNGYILAIDSFQDCVNIERIANKIGMKAKIFLRVNPGIRMSIEETIFSSATTWAKCANIISTSEELLKDLEISEVKSWFAPLHNIPLKDTAEYLSNYIDESPMFNFLGIHAHPGSQVTSLDYYYYFSLIVTRFFKHLNESLNNHLEYLDIGGGFPVDYNSGKNIPEVKEIAKVIISNIEKAKISPKLILESGRYITANAGSLLSKVVLTKENAVTKNIAVLDVSFYSDLIDTIAAHWYFESKLVNDLPNEEESEVYELFGITNDSLDLMDPQKRVCSCGKIITPERKREFPRVLNSGDLVLIMNAGAYSTCFNSNYCLHSKPPVILIDTENKIHLIRKKQSYEETVLNEGT
ncbi:MAG: hypothetical protein KAT16_06465 [Candidatus Heimdallarchaeota archaeon]|nr:hypothetical protein [Candidatus Heimdallarchaeota archaeon]